MNTPIPSKPTWLFWLSLAAPSCLSLAVVAVNAAGIRGSSVAGIAILPMIGACLFSAIFCGLWLARRFGKSAGQKVLIGLVSFAGLLAVNLIISVAGCADNVSFH